MKRGQIGLGEMVVRQTKSVSICLALACGDIKAWELLFVGGFLVAQNLAQSGG